MSAWAYIPLPPVWLTGSDEDGTEVFGVRARDDNGCCGTFTPFHPSIMFFREGQLHELRRRHEDDVAHVASAVLDAMYADARCTQLTAVTSERFFQFSMLSLGTLSPREAATSIPLYVGSLFGRLAVITRNTWHTDDEGVRHVSVSLERTVDDYRKALASRRQR